MKRGIVIAFQMRIVTGKSWFSGFATAGATCF